MVILYILSKAFAGIVDSINWAVAAPYVASAVALFIAICGVWLRGLFFKPKLKVTVTPDSSDSHKVAARDTKTEKFSHYCYYFRFKVENEGNSKMDNVQVIAVECHKKNAAGLYEKQKGFLPLNLSWAHFRYEKNPTDMPTIHRDLYRVCSLGYITKSKDADLKKYGRPELSQYDVVFNLSTVWKPYSGEHILPPGDYKIQIKVAADNLKPKSRTFKLHVEDKWTGDDEEGVMFSINKLSLED